MKLKPYPEWVCTECAKKANGKIRHLVATYHKGLCDVCGQMAYVTEPRDYSYPHFIGFRKP
jgi:hypothetical protein